MQDIKIMGILNVTPDSFSDGGSYEAVDKALKRVEEMIEEGASIIDIGAESSRPGSTRISAEEEIDRLLPIVTRVKDSFDIPVSIDTYKPEVANCCLEASVDIINDITGFMDDAMIEVCAKYTCGIVIMHMQGTPETMQKKPHYIDVIGEVKDFLTQQVQKAKQTGITDIIIDPGIGFGKSIEDNCLILQKLKSFEDIGCPLLIGASRKSFIGKILDLEVGDRLEGSLAALAVAYMNGASVFRVHDVKESRRFLDMLTKVC